jgi:hypothetical protein
MARIAMTGIWVAALGMAGLLAGAAPTQAADLEFYTGQMLYTQCQARSGEADYNVHAAQCAGYVLGVSDAQQAAQGAGRPLRVCLPGTVTAPQLVATVRDYLTTHADKRPLAAQDLVLNALAVAFPCK